MRASRKKFLSDVKFQTPPFFRTNMVGAYNKQNGTQYVVLCRESYCMTADEWTEDRSLIIFFQKPRQSRSPRTIWLNMEFQLHCNGYTQICVKKNIASSFILRLVHEKFKCRSCSSNKKRRLRWLDPILLANFDKSEYLRGEMTNYTM